MMKKLFAICCFSALGATSFAQNGNVIRAKKTTDPNYEINLKKSEEVRRRNAMAKSEVVKDKAYYENELANINKQIERATQLQNDGVSQPKLPHYIEERERIKAKIKSL